MAGIDRTPPSDRGRSVLIIVENLPVPFDRRVWQEAKTLQDAGYLVSVICPKGKGYDRPYECVDNVHIYRHSLPMEASGAFGFLAEYGSALFWEFVLSFKILKRHGFDIIHACNPPDLIFIVALFHKLLFGKKFLFDHHDICPELYEAKFGKRGLFHRLLVLFERLTFWCADVSVATNERFREIALSRGAMSPDRVKVVKSYPDFGRFYRVDPDQNLRCGKEYLIGYVGIIGQQDGVDLLVQAMAHIAGPLGRSDVQCLIIGDGPELRNLKSLAVELGLTDRITFTGYLTGKTLLAHLSSLDIGVIPDPPNPYNDKISMNKVFEYMALGLPIVQFDLGQAREEAREAAVIAEGDSPEALGDSIIALLADEEARRRMSAYGRERACKEFRWDNEKKTLLAAYELLYG